MLDKLLDTHKDDLIAAITGKLGVNPDQAGGFLQKLFDMIEGLIGSGKLDIDSLLKGNIGDLKNKLNLDVLGSALGGDAEKGEEGLGAVMGPLSEKLGGLGNAEDIISQLTGSEGGGGIMGALGGILGKR